MLRSFRRALPDRYTLGGNLTILRVFPDCIDLIDSINPFQQAFEVISKSITPKILKSIQECIAAFKVNMTDEEAIYLWPKINEFVKVTRRQPSLDALDPTERRLAEALIYLRQLKRDQKNG